MRSSKEELFQALDRIAGVPVVVVGDVILDRYIWGDVDRISQEAPVPVVDVKRSEDRLGGAGNVARNLRCIGARVSICGLLGDDEEGRTVLRLLEADGIERDGMVIDRSRPTTLKTRIMSRGQQLVRIDRENRERQPDALRESFAALVDAHIDPAKAVIVSDYGKGVISPEVMGRMERAYAAKRLGVGVRPYMVDPHPANYALYSHISMSKPNRKEAEAATGIKIRDKISAFEAAQKLLKLWGSEMVVLSLGEGGLLIASSGATEGIFMDTLAQQVFDVSGAGDTVCSVFTAAIASGSSTVVAADLANVAAGVVVSEVGTVPVNLQKLKKAIEGFAKH